MSNFYVYVHTCPNGKKYVGITTQDNPEKRWLGGRGYVGQFFGKAILKYGWDNIQHEVFEVESKEEMYRKEIELISFYHSNDPQYGYNCSEGGEKSSLGCHFTLSEEAKLKISKAQKGRKKSEEHRRHNSEAHKGVKKGPHTQEWIRDVSEKNRGKKRSPEFRERMSRLMKGKTKGVPKSEEQKRKMSEAQRGKSKPKVKWLFPDGQIREMTRANATRFYLSKGIVLVEL